MTSGVKASEMSSPICTIAVSDTTLEDALTEKNI